MISYLIRTRVALRRIETFLNTPNVRGLTTTPLLPNQQASNIGAIEMIDLTFGWLPTLKQIRNHDDNINDSINRNVQDRSVVGDEQRRNCCNFFRRYSNEVYTQSKKYFGSASNKSTSTSSTTTTSNIKIKATSDLKNTTLKYSLLDEDDEDDEYYNDEYYNDAQKNLSDVHNYGVELGNMSNDSQSLHYSVVNTHELGEDGTKFSGTIVIENSSLNISPKSLTIIVGVTGSGKSSLLHGE